MKAATQARIARISTKTLYCSFCIKSEHEVRKLISGPAHIFICNECVGLCEELIAGHAGNSSKFPAAKELSTKRLLELPSLDQ